MRRVILVFAAILLTMPLLQARQKSDTLRVLYWNIQNGMWADQHNNYDNVVILEFNASYGTLTKVAVSASGNWYQVSYVGTIGTKTYNGTEALYMTASVVSGGWVADSAGSIGGGSLG